MSLSWKSPDDFCNKMKQCLCRYKTGLFMLKICSIAKVLLMQMQIPSCETVSPNSPVKVQPSPCSLSKYLHIDENGINKCRRCSVCPKGFQVLTECSFYNNTVCKACSSGWYNDVSGSSCKPCSGCNQGEYIRRDCSVKRDTSCRPCPRDTFSVYANATRCESCRRCKHNEKTVSKCDANKDTVCGECDNGYFRVASTWSCLPCSRCPNILKHRVVPECRDERGIHHPDICWPNDSLYRFPYSSEDGVTEGIINVIQEISADDIPTIFFIIVVCSFLCGTVIIVIFFICLRQLFPNRHFNTRLSVPIESTQTFLPLLPVFANTDDGYNTRHDSQTAWTNETVLVCSGYKTQTDFQFQENISCRDSMDTTFEIADSALCAEDNYCYNHEFDGRSGSAPMFTTADLVITCDESLRDESAHSKPWYSEHRIYRTI